jgi:hypothetical protein
MPQTDSPTARAAPLGNDQVCQAVNRWSRGGFFRVRNFGDRITLHEVAARAAHTVRLWSEYETRTISRASRPYNDGPVDDRGTPPDRWELPARRPTEFEDRSETLPVPHTERVETCTGCHGVGQVTCTACQGLGLVNCPFCQGRGYRERMQTRTEPGPDGNLQTRMEPVRDPCTCNAGKVACTTCAGRGRVRCAPCAGSGRVLTFDQLKVRFQAEAKNEALTAADVPLELLRAASGKVRVVEDGERIETFPGVLPAVDEAARAMLSKAQAPRADTRLLFQRLRVEEMGVHEVLYTYGGGAVRRLWIYGDEGHVHAPHAPWSRLRVGAVVGAVLAVVAVVVLAIVFLVH